MGVDFVFRVCYWDCIIKWGLWESVDTDLSQLAMAQYELCG